MSISGIMKAEKQFGFSLGCSKTLTLTRMITMVLTAGSGWRFLRRWLVPEHRRLFLSKYGVGGRRSCGASTYRSSTRKHVGRVKSVMVGKRNLPATSAPWCRNRTLSCPLKRKRRATGSYLVYSCILYPQICHEQLYAKCHRPLQPFSSEFHSGDVDWYTVRTSYRVNTQTRFHDKLVKDPCTFPTILSRFLQSFSNKFIKLYDHSRSSNTFIKVYDHSETTCIWEIPLSASD